MQISKIPVIAYKNTFHIIKLVKKLFYFNCVKSLAKTLLILKHGAKLYWKYHRK